MCRCLILIGVVRGAILAPTRMSLPGSTRSGGSRRSIFPPSCTRDVFRRSLVSTLTMNASASHRGAGAAISLRGEPVARTSPCWSGVMMPAKSAFWFDPATWSTDGTVTFAEWRASRDGKRVAYAVQDGGSDWRTIRVLDVATGKETSDVVQWARMTQIAWANDGSGFYYSRYPEPKPGLSDASGLIVHAIYFHRIRRRSRGRYVVLRNAVETWRSIPPGSPPMAATP